MNTQLPLRLLRPVMIQPLEMSSSRPMRVQGGMSTTTDVWQMLVASQRGDLEEVKALARKNPALLTCQYDYTSPLHFAVREGHLALVQYLVEHAGLDPRCRNHPYLESLVTLAEDRAYGEIADCLKQTLDDPALVRQWADSGRIDLQRSKDEQRFQQAVDEGRHSEVEAMLVERPALAVDPNAFWGEGILAMPAKEGDRPMMELLMRYGARVPDISKWAKEYYFKNYDSAVFLLDRGASPNHQSWRKATVLHDLVFKGEERTVQLLLDRGADINAVDEEYYSTPLGHAAHWGHQEKVTLLLSRGADVNRAGAPWATPLEWARKKGHAGIEAELRSAGARVE